MSAALRRKDYLLKHPPQNLTRNEWEDMLDRINGKAERMGNTENWLKDLTPFEATCLSESIDEMLRARADAALNGLR